MVPFAALAEFGLRGEIRDGRVGVWIVRPDKPPLPDGTMREDKIAALGIKLRRWVSFHGISINVKPDLSHYGGMGRALSFVRTGTLDEPGAVAPDIHIFTATRRPWVTLPDGVPAMEVYYRASEHWSAEALARREALRGR